MIITVRVKTGSRADSISFDTVTGRYLVSVKAKPVEGEANKAIIKLLSEELNISKTNFRLKSGAKSTIKLFEY